MAKNGKNRIVSVVVIIKNITNKIQVFCKNIHLNNPCWDIQVDINLYDGNVSRQLIKLIFMEYKIYDKEMLTFRDSSFFYFTCELSFYSS